MRQPTPMPILKYSFNCAARMILITLSAPIKIHKDGDNVRRLATVTHCRCCCCCCCCRAFQYFDTATVHPVRCASGKALGKWRKADRMAVRVKHRNVSIRDEAFGKHCKACVMHALHHIQTLDGFQKSSHARMCRHAPYVSHSSKVVSLAVV